MSNMIQAAESIRRLAVLLQDMTFAADALESIGALEQAKEEAHRALKIAQDDVQKAKDEAQSIRDKAFDAALEDKVAVDAYVLKANQDGTAIVAAATNKAALILDEAVSNAKAAQAEAQSKVEKMELKLKLLNEEVANAGADLSQIVSVRDAAAVELAELRANIETAKAAVRKLLGGE